jgi:hypothetical protein
MVVAASVVAGWLADSVVVSVAVNFVVVDSANFVVVDSMIAISGAAASDLASATRMTTMTTTPILIRMDMDMGMALIRMGTDMAITRTPPTTMRTKTTAVAM